MDRYAAYGLTFRSEHPLPFAPAPDGGEADILIDHVGRSAPGAPIESGWRQLQRDGLNWSLRFSNHQGAWMRYDYDAAGRRLRIAGSGRWEDAVPALAAAVCAILLASEGRTLLHGAALELAGGAVAILGDGGMGKSTLAASLRLAGARLLSEDLLRFEQANGQVTVHSGHRFLSLLPDTHAFLGSPAADLQAGTGKYWLDTEPALPAPHPLPLRAIFILAPPDRALADSLAERLHPAEAAFILMRHLYGAEWIRSPSPEDLASCTELATKVAVFNLARPAGLDHVAKTATLIAQLAKRQEDHR